jgi:hypothetical protein
LLLRLQQRVVINLYYFAPWLQNNYNYIVFAEKIYCYFFHYFEIGAICNVIPVKCKRVSTHTLMFWAGLGNIIFSFMCVPLPKLDLVTLFHPYELGKCNNCYSSDIQYFEVC